MEPKGAVVLVETNEGCHPTNIWLHEGASVRLLLTPHIAVHCQSLKEKFNKLAYWGFSTPIFESLIELFNTLKRIYDHSLIWARVYCSVVYQNWRGQNAKKYGR